MNPSDIKTRKEKTKILSLLNAMKEFNIPTVEHVDQNNFSEPVRVERFVIYSSIFVLLFIIAP